MQYIAYLGDECCTSGWFKIAAHHSLWNTSARVVCAHRRHVVINFRFKYVDAQITFTSLVGFPTNLAQNRDGWSDPVDGGCIVTFNYRQILAIDL